MAFNPQITSEIKEDWNNRENIEIIATGMKSLVDFLNRFDSSCRVKLSQLDSKLTNAEKQVDFLEAQVERSLKQQAYQQQILIQSHTTNTSR